MYHTYLDSLLLWWLTRSHFIKFWTLNKFSNLSQFALNANLHSSIISIIMNKQHPWYLASYTHSHINCIKTVYTPHTAIASILKQWCRLHSFCSVHTHTPLSAFYSLSILSFYFIFCAFICIQHFMHTNVKWFCEKSV